MRVAGLELLRRILMIICKIRDFQVYWKKRRDYMKKNAIKVMLSVLTFAFVIMPALANGFPDVAPSHWAAKQIKILSQQSVIVGYPDGTFKPDENVSRAEFASMAIRALGQENARVVQPVNFSDISTDFWAYDSIQKALYFDLISAPKAGEEFRPDDTVTRAEAISVSVNALTTEQISPLKAKEVLSKVYSDYKTIPEWFLIPAGKAEILNMLVVIPNKPKMIEATRPATRAEVAAILYDMTVQAKLNPNKKLADAMRKKTGEGYVVEEAYVQGSIGTLPAGSIIPMQVGNLLGSQATKAGEIYVAKAPENYVTKDKFILVAKGSDIKGQVLDVRPGRLFIRNGVLVLNNELLVTTNDQTVPFKGVADIKNKHGWFVTFLRKVFKGDKVKVLPQGCVYVKLLEDLKVDLTNGWVIE